MAHGNTGNAWNIGRKHTDATKRNMSYQVVMFGGN